MDTESHTAHPEPGSDRSFGIVFAVVFLAIALWPLLSGREPRWWALAGSVAFGAAALAMPRVLAPLNRAWAAFGLLLGRIVSPVALAVLFLAAFLPTGLLMRLFGQRPLALRRDPQARTYWVEREPRGTPGDGMKNQF